MRESLVNRVVSVEEDLKKIKTSQLMGKDNYRIYPAFAQSSATIPYGVGGGTITYTGAEPLPLVTLEVEFYLDGNKVVFTGSEFGPWNELYGKTDSSGNWFSIFAPIPNGREASNVFVKNFSISLSDSQNSHSVQLVLNAKASCTGTLDILWGDFSL